MDWRIVVVLAPIILAGSWAAFNIFQAAMVQLNKALGKDS
jgi:photosystem II PsbY protein